MLAAGSAALFIALSNHVVSEFDFPAFVRTDPIRIIRAIIVGVSFFGAGTILKRESQGRVEGLTTAARLAAAGVGIAVALRLWLVSVGTTVLILVVNRVLGMIEARWLPGPAD